MTTSTEHGAGRLGIRLLPAEALARVLGLFRLPRRNRYRLGRLGNALVRGGSLRRAA